MKLMHYSARPNLASSTLGRLVNLQDELERLFETPMQAWAPALDVHEDKDGYTVRVELPGMKREEIEVSIQNDVVSISGERKFESPAEGVEVHRQERSHGKFFRTLTLPTAVDGNRVKASYKEGILTVTVPKAEAAKPKQVTIGE